MDIWSNVNENIVETNGEQGKYISCTRIYFLIHELAEYKLCVIALSTN